MKWYDKIKAICSDKIQILLVGNKIDLEQERQVSLEEGKEMSENFNMFY